MTLPVLEVGVVPFFQKAQLWSQTGVSENLAILPRGDPPASLSLSLPSQEVGSRGLKASMPLRCLAQRKHPICAISTPPTHIPPSLFLEKLRSRGKKLLGTEKPISKSLVPRRRLQDGF